MSIKELMEQLEGADGKEFENRFGDIMKEIYKSRFQRTQVYMGDMKADGLILDDKTIFAVHGPETFKQDSVLKKISGDYGGFIEHKKQGNWKAINNWIFVLKSPRKGIPSKILDYITSIDGENDVSTGIWGLEDIKKLIMEWAPPELPSEILDKLKSITLQLLQGGGVITKDYEENRDRLLHPTEWFLQSLHSREEACKHISSMIDEIKRIYMEYPGALEEIGVDGSIRKLAKLQPDSINIVTIEEAYDKLCQKTEKGNYVLLKQCEKILKRLRKS